MKLSRGERNILLSMIVFGTISIAVRNIDLASGVIAMGRGIIGGLLLLGVKAFRGERPDGAAVRKNLRYLLPAGVLLGFNWMLLFEAYRYTSVATATLCYYMAPVFIVLASPWVIGEKLTLRKALCVLAAMVGMVFVSGAAEGGLPSAGERRGILLAVASAILYATIVLANKKMEGIGAFDRTLVELFISAVVILPYNALTGGLSGMVFSGKTVFFLLLAGILYTGIPYVLYFSSLESVAAQTAAILSYVDPVVAVLVSVFVFRETLTAGKALGALLILGAMFLCEVELPRKKT